MQRVTEVIPVRMSSAQSKRMLDEANRKLARIKQEEERLQTIRERYAQTQATREEQASKANPAKPLSVAELLAAGQQPRVDPTAKTGPLLSELIAAGQEPVNPNPKAGGYDQVINITDVMRRESRE